MPFWFTLPLSSDLDPHVMSGCYSGLIPPPWNTPQTLSARDVVGNLYPTNNTTDQTGSMSLSMMMLMMEQSKNNQHRHSEQVRLTVNPQVLSLNSTPTSLAEAKYEYRTHPHWPMPPHTGSQRASRNPSLESRWVGNAGHDMTPVRPSMQLSGGGKKPS